jgi:transketolase
MAIATALGYDDLPRLLTRLTGDEKHDWSALSTLDVLWVLHDRVLGPDDRFLLSKGHGPAAGIGRGSLGHGLPIAVGAALSGRRIYCLVGDAELDEGSNWEAVQYAGRVGLGTLNVVVLDNHSSTYHWPGGIAARFELEGWNSATVDGRDHDALESALSTVSDTPHVVVAEVERKR